MKIGVVSDTHDRLRYIHLAVDVFNRSGVGLVLHAGDYIAPFALRPLDRLQGPWAGVLGNNDGEVAGLMKASGGRIKGSRLEQVVDGRSILVVHDEQTLGGKAYPRGVDVLVFGHSHQARVARQAGMVVVNPGECCGYLENRATVALLDTEDLGVEIVELNP